MKTKTNSRIMSFIDGSNLYATAKNLGMEIDYKKLMAYMNEKGDVIRNHYYTAIVEDQEYSSIRPLIDWLDYNGFTVVTKPAKEYTDANGRRKIKGSMDIEMCVHALEAADHCTDIFLFTGDGDFRALVEAIQRKGVRVTVFSTVMTAPPMVSDELRRQCDQFIDLSKIKSVVGREFNERPTNGHTHDANELPDSLTRRT